MLVFRSQSPLYFCFQCRQLGPDCRILRPQYNPISFVFLLMIQSCGHGSGHRASLLPLINYVPISAQAREWLLEDRWFYNVLSKLGPISCVSGSLFPTDVHRHGHLTLCLRKLPRPFQAC
ncbi:hypothetical protein PAXRUDRAFT_516111 [Paxillus rubicundulus Ve08.2h10]|uniref:Uncharacterized protein n=1 Tax=Paxillus rubicundulus Ve08.2h10 TaxID=930991 RepID=A0A0D0DVD8_9AGAM|nr:hypothetical protein PAXRUDRAFT_516111 [Paxillus rubicundulus Ve08.2h10]